MPTGDGLPPRYAKINNRASSSALPSLYISPHQQLSVSANRTAPLNLEPPITNNPGSILTPSTAQERVSLHERDKPGITPQRTAINLAATCISPAVDMGWRSHGKLISAV